MKKFTQTRKQFIQTSFLMTTGTLLLPNLSLAAVLFANMNPIIMAKSN